jgi:acyl-CoA synthetase (NDP forming)
MLDRGRMKPGIGRSSKTIESPSIRHALRPRSIAVIGASRDPQKVGSRILEELRTGGFCGALYVVHPEAPAIQGLAAVPSARELPRGIDLAIVCVPAERVPDVVDDCAHAGVRTLVVVAAGFAETGQDGRVAQTALLNRVRAAGMRMVGPNSLGIVNLDPTIRLHAACSPILPLPGGISLASQSGTLGIAVLDLAAEREVGLSSFVSVGNKADVSSNDLLEYWEDDPATRVILLYLESFGNPLRFARIARRVALKKPIVALKAGRTDWGTRSVGPHIASLANHDTVTRAIFQQTGIITADRIDEMFDVAVCLDLQPLPKGRRVAIVTNAGGAGILAADACAVSGLTVASLSDVTGARLASIPAVLADPGVDSLVVIHMPTESGHSAEVLASIGHAVEAARTSGVTHKPVLVCSVTRRRRAAPIETSRERLPAYVFPENAVRALGKIAAYADWLRESSSIEEVFDGEQSGSHSV